MAAETTARGVPKKKRGQTLVDLPTFLTVGELARLMQVNRNTVYAAIERGEIPGVRRVGICRDTVVEWLRGQGRGARSSRR